MSLKIKSRNRNLLRQAKDRVNFFMSKKSEDKKEDPREFKQILAHKTPDSSHIPLRKGKFKKFLSLKDKIGNI